jgi:VWFA-related protein
LSPTLFVSAVVASLLVAPGTGFSSGPTPAPQREVTQERAPHFRASVDRVRVDVIVTDREGRFVADLRPDEFILYEDDVSQPILDFQRVDLIAGEVTDLTVGGEDTTAPTDPRPSPDSAPEGMSTTSATSGVPAGELGAMVFLIDGPSFDPDIRASFSTAWTQIIEQAGALEIPSAVYFVSAVGQVAELVPLSSDVSALRAAAESVGSLPTYGTTTEQRLRELMDAMEDPRAPGTAGWSLKLRSFEAEERARSIDTLSLLTRFCEALSTRAGRTALVWVSTGIKLTEGGPAAAVDASQEAVDDSRPLSPRDTNWAHFTTDSALMELQRHLQDVANSANVSIYSIDPTPLASLRGSAFDASVGGNMAAGGGSGRDGGGRSIPRADILSSTMVQDSMEGLRDSLRSAAEATGGKAMINYTDLAVAMAEIRDHASRFYLLTYAPPSSVKDGEFREVRVEIRRPGLTVRERGGYIAMPTEERETREIAAAMDLPGAARALKVEAETYRRWSAAGELDVQIGVNMGGLGTAFGSMPELDLFLAVFDDEGRLVREVSRAIRTRTASTAPDSISSILPFGQFGASWWDLDAGLYEVRLVAKDPLSARLGAVRFALEVPAKPESWAVSDARLGVAVDGASTRPLVGGRAVVGQQIVAFVEVAGGGEPELSGRVVVARRAEVDGPEPRAITLRRASMRKGNGSTHRGAVPLPLNLTPGCYTIELRVEDPAMGQERTLRVPLEIHASSQGPVTGR